MWRFKKAEIVVKFSKIDPGINIALYGQEGEDGKANPGSLIKNLVPEG